MKIITTAALPFLIPYKNFSYINMLVLIAFVAFTTGCSSWFYKKKVKYSQHDRYITISGNCKLIINKKTNKLKFLCKIEKNKKVNLELLAMFGKKILVMNVDKSLIHIIDNYNRTTKVYSWIEISKMVGYRLTYHSFQKLLLGYAIDKKPLSDNYKTKTIGHYSFPIIFKQVKDVNNILMRLDIIHKKYFVNLKLKRKNKQEAEYNEAKFDLQLVSQNKLINCMLELTKIRFRSKNTLQGHIPATDISKKKSLHL